MTDKIHAAMTAILNEVGAIGKDSRNATQGWKFRGVDAVYNSLHGIMAKYKVYTIPRVVNISREEKQSKKGGTLLYSLLTIEYDFIADDGSKVTACVIGEAMDSGDKSCNKAMAVAHKYVLFQAFMIPTELSQDPDAETHVVAENKAKPASDKQFAAINDYIKEEQIPPKTLDWIRSEPNWENLTYSQATKILKVCKDYTKGENE